MTSSNVKGKAVTTKKIFSRETSISIDIQADIAKIWGLLINASNYSKWNSTIISIEGKIALGEKINLKSVLDPKRIFKLKVKEFEPEKRLVWGDAMGNRVYILSKNDDESINFSMSEKIGGPIFPLFAGFIPSFDESFEKFATDLKQEAEKV
jgi:uncharacterized protein YndB with AHSA1/START domain